METGEFVLGDAVKDIGEPGLGAGQEMEEC